jgi:hypothetical protein
MYPVSVRQNLLLLGTNRKPTGWFEYVSALGASLLVDATGRLFRKERKEITDDDGEVQDISEDEDSEDSEDEADFEDLEYDSRSPRGMQTKKGTPLLGLEYLISSLAIFDVTKPHDTIYALLAIANDTTPVAATKEIQYHKTKDQLEMFTQKKSYIVDYSKNYVEVCKDFVEFCVSQSLHTDPTRALDVICRPWATKKPPPNGDDVRNKPFWRQKKRRPKSRANNNTVESSIPASVAIVATNVSENISSNPTDGENEQVNNGNDSPLFSLSMKQC